MLVKCLFCRPLMMSWKHEVLMSWKTWKQLCHFSMENDPWHSPHMPNINSPDCNTCNTPESVQHYLALCSESNTVFLWLLTSLQKLCQDIIREKIFVLDFPYLNAFQKKCFRKNPDYQTADMRIVPFGSSSTIENIGGSSKNGNLRAPKR